MFRLAPAICLTLLLTSATTPTAVAQPSVRQALSLVPMQSDVEFDRPSEAEVPECTINPTREGDQRAWVVLGPGGGLLRQFVDTNGDNRIDQWCYYRGGIEVYRDIDGDFNEKADQYRWFGTGGMRWGLDQNEDGQIDDWKWISPEEVSSELVRAIGEKDSQRFAALLVTKEELQKLAFKTEAADQIVKRTSAAKSKFAEFTADQKDVTEKTRWIDFSAPGPGVVPAGGQADQDLIVYENVIAMTETDGQHGEVQIGTLLRIGDSWRIIDLPSSDGSGFFFTATGPRAATLAEGAGGISPRLQGLIQKLEELDKGLASATSEAAIRRVHAQRTGLLRELVQVTTDDNRDMWLLQLIDSVVAASQTGDGTTDRESLAKLLQEVQAATENQEIIGQAKFNLLTADYSDSLQQPKADFAAIQAKWIKSLESFVDDFAETRPASEAMLQLAISHEFAGQDDEAITWYGKIVENFPDTEMAEKAIGAKRRLQSVGKPLELRGTGLDGRPVDTATLRGNLILVHYWATWCEPCKQDMKQLRQLLAKYQRRKFAVVGVNLDNQPKAAVEYLRSEQMSWHQLHEPGGLESPLAKKLGIFTLPVMLLIDKSGAVANRSITAEELEAELKKRLTTGR